MTTMDHYPPDPILEHAPDAVVADGPRLVRWLAHHGLLRPSLLAVERERQRRGLRRSLR